MSFLMRQRVRVTLAVFFWALLVSFVTAPFGAEEKPQAAPQAVTTTDPEIPVEELALLLKPLPKDKLLVEVDAWQALLQEKAEEIARAEIAVQRQNREVGARVEKQQAVKTAAQTMERAEDRKKKEKVALLEQVNTLREERTVIIDRLNAVLDELQTKTDEEDTDTLAKIRGCRLYISSVQGIRVDVKDATSTWIAVKGWLNSDEGGLRWTKNIALFLGILIAAWILSKILSGMVQRALKMTGGVSQLLDDFLVRSVRWLVMIVGAIMALAALEVSVGPLLAVVGAAGFVIAFALQDSLSNFASGLMILFFRPFDVGDVVDAGGVSGKVSAMNLVSTSIKTFDNKDMVVPNNKIWQDVITNATGVDTRRVDMEFGIGYDDDIDKAQAILEEIVAAHPKALKDPEPTIRMNTLADSSVNFICRPWAKTVDYWDVYWDVTKAVKQRFDAEGVGIPFPQRDVHLYIAEGSSKQPLAGLSKGQVASQGPNPQPYELNDDEGNSPDK
jgi:small conductance mechanosensitive channel